jgi:hypothetical protein
MTTAAAMAAVAESLATALAPTASVTPPSTPASTIPLAPAESSTATAQPNASASNASAADFPDGPAEVLDDTPDGDIAWLNVNELTLDEADELKKMCQYLRRTLEGRGP